MEKNILLVTSSFEGVSKNLLAKTNEEMHYPLGIAYLHSYLESKNYKVKSLFLNHWSKEDCLNEVIKNIKEFSPKVIGFQMLTSTRVSAYNIINYIHKNHPDIKILLGGIHATVMYKQLINKFPFAFAILGEGEVTMEELIKELFKEKPNPKKIYGVAFSKNGIVSRTKSRNLIKDLDSLPFPNHKQYLGDGNRTSACLLTSRGCPNACSFCCLNPENKRKVRFRTPKSVVDEIEYITKEFPHITNIWIHDDSFFIHNQRVIDICDEIINRNIKVEFTCSGRMKPVSKEMIEKLEQAGFKCVLLGLESGSEQILKSCHKGITPEDVINTFKLFSKSSIEIKSFLIVGLPGETIDTIKETVKLVRKMQKIKYTLIYPFFNLLCIYPGTEVYEIAKEKGFIDDSYWLTEKETPIYTAEHSYEQLKSFEQYLANHLSFYRIKTKKGFFPQITMLPYVVKYFFKKKKSWKLIRNVIKEFFK